MTIKVLIEGQVQGVFYRAHTKKKAQQLGLKGWVKNLPDGRVEVVFQGPKEKVEQMINWCWQGSPLSRVSQVKRVPQATRENFQDFEIIY
jgi:acylphosphatase